MSQSRTHSLVETLTSIAIGFVVSMGINAVVLPAYGHQVTLTDNIQITGIFTVASILRGYLVRRWFNGLAGRGKRAADDRWQPGTITPRHALWIQAPDASKEPTK